MASTYHYKAYVSKRGIITIILTCKIAKLKKKNPDIIKISDEIYLYINEEVKQKQGLKDDDISALVKGVSLMEQAIVDSKENFPVLIKVTDLVFNLVDYQAEGLTVAIMGWISQEIGIEFRKPKVGFDEENHRYTFDFNMD